jgi:hypothetical protein
LVRPANARTGAPSPRKGDTGARPWPAEDFTRTRPREPRSCARTACVSVSAQPRKPCGRTPASNQDPARVMGASHTQRTRQQAEFLKVIRRVPPAQKRHTELKGQPSGNTTSAWYTPISRSRRAAAAIASHWSPRRTSSAESRSRVLRAIRVPRSSTRPSTPASTSQASCTASSST